MAITKGARNRIIINMFVVLFVVVTITLLKEDIKKAYYKYKVGEDKNVLIVDSYFTTGKDISDICLPPEKEMYEDIEKRRLELDDLKLSLDIEKESLEKPYAPYETGYKDRVENYNQDAQYYNSFYQETEELITEYNQLVAIWRECSNS
ncbi:hypothetical protein KC842_00710 [Candidatus Nomurabacteria bacterium]|nr:hypothetical protein [Candidatus Nomurabacteria bacterium]USN94909.1 MAG: hypothetical protein H6791_00575 [Candidatus Nomurabacteria bacterium]